MEEKKVLFSVSHLKIMTAKHLLSEAGITAFSIDKMDSAHAILHRADIDEARNIVLLYRFIKKISTLQLMNKRNRLDRNLRRR